MDENYLMTLLHNPDRISTELCTYIRAEAGIHKPIATISTSRKRVIGGLYRQICATPALAGGARGERTLRSTRGFRDL
ncbi:MAG: hypothetical protein Q8L87_08290, partial [Anaerolineales bacterium]|nr:hypothetical protein [Anaerolineales bacterium]